MAPSSLVKGRRVEHSRMGPQEEWSAVLRRPAKTKASTALGATVPGSGPPSTASGISNCGLSAIQARSGARIPGARPAQDFPRGVLSRAEMDSRIGQLREMGFSEQAARDALGETSWNLNAALDLLFTRVSPRAAPASTDVACCDVSCSVASVNADADTLSTLSVESRSQSDTEPDATVTGSPRANGGSSSGSSHHGSEDCSSIQESHSQTRSPHSGPNPEPSSSSIDVFEGTTAQTEAHSNQPLHRLKEAWIETDATQLGMREGGLVRMWLGTETELGWVYVEEIGGKGRAGWMPSYILEAVQDGHTAVRAVHSCEARFENQLSVQEGRMFLIDMHSRTDDGWVYAKTIESPESAMGWIPIMCLEWPEL